MSKMKDLDIFLEGFVQGYVECVLWTDEDNGKEDAESNGKDWEDLDWSSENIAGQSTDRIEKVCRDFVIDNWEDLCVYEGLGRSSDYIGHDFALSRSGHGTGFWDRGAGDLGDRLHKAAKVYGESSLYFGQDWRIYYSG